LAVKDPNYQQRTSEAFYLLHTALGNGAMKKFEVCFNWSNEHFTARMLFFCVGNGAMNAPRYWQLRDDSCKCTLYRLHDEISADKPRFPIATARENTWPRWQLGSSLQTALQGDAESLKGSHRMGDGFSENLALQ
jgi:hypothetical protein